EIPGINTPEAADSLANQIMQGEFPEVLQNNPAKLNQLFKAMEAELTQLDQRLASVRLESINLAFKQELPRPVRNNLILQAEIPGINTPEAADSLANQIMQGEFPEVLQNNPAKLNQLFKAMESSLDKLGQRRQRIDLIKKDLKSIFDQYNIPQPDSIDIEFEVELDRLALRIYEAQLLAAGRQIISKIDTTGINIQGIDAISQGVLGIAGMGGLPMLPKPEQLPHSVSIPNLILEGVNVALVKQTPEYIQRVLQQIGINLGIERVKSLAYKSQITSTDISKLGLSDTELNKLTALIPPIRLFDSLIVAFEQLPEQVALGVVVQANISGINTPEAAQAFISKIKQGEIPDAVKNDLPKLTQLIEAVDNELGQFIINEWRDLGPAFAIDVKDLPGFARFVFREGASYGAKHNWMGATPDNYFHTGVDIFEYETTDGSVRSIPLGTPVRAILSGTVIQGKGELNEDVVIQTAEGKLVRYGHITPSVDVGSQINKGEIIGIFNKSEYVPTATPHLHLEVINGKFTLPSPNTYDNQEEYELALAKYIAELASIQSFDSLLLWPNLADNSKIETEQELPRHIDMGRTSTIEESEKQQRDLVFGKLKETSERWKSAYGEKDAVLIVDIGNRILDWIKSIWSKLFGEESPQPVEKPSMLTDDGSRRAEWQEAEEVPEDRASESDSEKDIRHIPLQKLPAPISVLRELINKASKALMPPAPITPTPPLQTGVVPPIASKAPEGKIVQFARSLVETIKDIINITPAYASEEQVTQHVSIENAAGSELVARAGPIGKATGVRATPSRGFTNISALINRILSIFCSYAYAAEVGAGNTAEAGLSIRPEAEVHGETQESGKNSGSAGSLNRGERGAYLLANPEANSGSINTATDIGRAGSTGTGNGPGVPGVTDAGGKDIDPPEQPDVPEVPEQGSRGVNSRTQDAEGVSKTDAALPSGRVEPRVNNSRVRNLLAIAGKAIKAITKLIANAVNALASWLKQKEVVLLSGDSSPPLGGVFVSDAPVQSSFLGRFVVIPQGKNLAIPSLNKFKGNNPTLLGQVLGFALNDLLHNKYGDLNLLGKIVKLLTKPQESSAIRGWLEKIAAAIVVSGSRLNTPNLRGTLALRRLLEQLKQGGVRCVISNSMSLSLTTLWRSIRNRLSLPVPVRTAMARFVSFLRLATVMAVFTHGMDALKAGRFSMKAMLRLFVSGLSTRLKKALQSINSTVPAQLLILSQPQHRRLRLLTLGVASLAMIAVAIATSHSPALDLPAVLSLGFMGMMHQKNPELSKNEKIKQALQHLTPKEATVIIYRYYGRFTLDEVAERLNVKRERVRQIQGKARRRLLYYARQLGFSTNEFPEHITTLAGEGSITLIPREFLELLFEGTGLLMFAQESRPLEEMFEGQITRKELSRIKKGSRDLLSKEQIDLVKLYIALRQKYYDSPENRGKRMISIARLADLVLAYGPRAEQILNIYFGLANKFIEEYKDHYYGLNRNRMLQELFMITKTYDLLEAELRFKAYLLGLSPKELYSAFELRLWELLSRRTRNMLRRNSLTLDALLSMNEKELLNIKNIGEVALGEIRALRERARKAGYTKIEASSWTVTVKEISFAAQDIKENLLGFNEAVRAARDLLENFLSNHSAEEIAKVLSNVSGKDIKAEDIIKRARVEFYSVGSHKWVFKLTFYIKNTKPVIVLMALKKEKEDKKRFITELEINNLIKLWEMGNPYTPNFGARFRSDDGRIFYLEEFIPGHTAQELYKKNRLSVKLRKKIVIALLSIGLSLNNSIPRDFHRNNFVIRDRAHPVMVDIGNRRFDISDENSHRAKVIFLAGLIAHYGFPEPNKLASKTNDFIFSTIIEELGQDKGWQLLNDALEYINQNEENLYQDLYKYGRNLFWVLGPAYSNIDGNLNVLKEFTDRFVDTFRDYIRRAQLNRGSPQDSPRGGGVTLEQLKQKVEAAKKGDKTAEKFLEEYSKDNPKLFELQMKQLNEEGDLAQTKKPLRWSQSPTVAGVKLTFAAAVGLITSLIFSQPVLAAINNSTTVSTNSISVIGTIGIALGGLFALIVIIKGIQSLRKDSKQRKIEFVKGPILSEGKKRANRGSHSDGLRQLKERFIACRERGDIKGQIAIVAGLPYHSHIPQKMLLGFLASLKTDNKEVKAAVNAARSYILRGPNTKTSVDVNGKDPIRKQTKPQIKDAPCSSLGALKYGFKFTFEGKITGGLFLLRQGIAIILAFIKEYGLIRGIPSALT
ncbi:MAG: sigma-70 family RNA polymerase sigma factor, partial [Candidatus Omnitrophota bacterium]